MRPKRRGPSRFYAFWLRRAYEAGYKDAIEHAKLAIRRSKQP